ncbi:MAG: hypothetical protein ACR2MB_11230 [Acidimicrobiales bacterium]
MAPKKKLSISLNAETADAIAESAELHGESVSAWIERVTREAMRFELGLAAVEEWEREHGAFTDEEIAEADRKLDEDFGPSRGRHRG